MIISLEIQTFVIVLDIVGLLQVIALFIQYRMNREYKGFGWCTLGTALLALGISLNYLSDTNLLWLLTIVVGNSLYVLSFVLLYIGVQVFLGQIVPRGRLMAFCAVVPLFSFYFTYLNNDFAARLVLNSVCIAAISFLTARSLFLNRIRSITTATYCLAVVSLAHGFILMMIALITLSGGSVGHFSLSSQMQIAISLDAFLISALWTFWLILMVNLRLRAEIRAEREKS